MLLSVTYGSENWDGGQTKVNLYQCGRPDRMLWQQARTPNTGIRLTSPTTVVSAGIGLRPDVVGKWTTQTYDVPDGALMRLHVLRTQRGQPRQASVLFRMRRGAALRRLSVDTIANPLSTLKRLDSEGRFDILTLAEAEALGYDPVEIVRRSLAPLAIRQMPCLSEAIIDGQLTAPVRHERVFAEGLDGEEVEIEAPGEGRAFDL